VRAILISGNQRFYSALSGALNTASTQGAPFFAVMVIILCFNGFYKEQQHGRKT
jgi:hypothetical protein